MFRIHFLDVGHGDSIILQFDNGRTYLIDHHTEGGKTPPLKYLVQTLGVKELETVVVTHPHRDHFRGIQQVIETIPIRQVWLSGYPFVGPSYEAFEHLLDMRKEIRVFFPRSGTFITEGKDRLHVLAPSANFLRGTRVDINNASLVLKVTVTHPQQDTSTSVILSADAEIASWQQILMEHGRNLQADSGFAENSAKRNLLKVSHHGSQYGSTPEALTIIRPQYSIISVGSNIYGHPNAQTLELIQAYTSHRVFRTDVDGTCIFESDGVRWNLVS